MKLTNANLTTKKEAIQRMLDGEVFYDSDGTYKLFYDEIVAGLPFMCIDLETTDKDKIKGFWNEIESWQIEQPWEPTIGKYYEFSDSTGFNDDVVVSILNSIDSRDSNEYRFVDDMCTGWKYIRPIPADLIGE